jgi:hypothetical protein
MSRNSAQTIQQFASHYLPRKQLGYEDDSQIWELHIQQNLSKDDPCVIVNLWEVKRLKS